MARNVFKIIWLYLSKSLRNTKIKEEYGGKQLRIKRG
jgi:hypothetical protein